LRDDPFSAFLEYPELVERYEKERDEKIGPISRRYKEKRDELLRSKNEGIKHDQDHRRILNACIFPFTVKGRMPGLGYSFVRASPLSEKGGPNLDFLIYNPSKQIAVFGEAKGSIADYGAVVDQTKERQRFVASNLQYANQHYLNSDKSSPEFVLGVGWMDANETVKAVLRKRGGIIVWQVGISLDDQSMKLSIVTPPKTSDGAHESMRHLDDALNKALVQVETSHKFKTFFIESHSVAKMLVLVHADKGKQDGLFDFNDLMVLVRQELDYLPEEQAKAEAARILELGESIGFLKRDKGKFMIDSRSKKASVRERELKDAWVRWAIARDEEEEVEKVLEPIRDKFKEVKKNYKNLSDFMR
jgi:hypothetical protein